MLTVFSPVLDCGVVLALNRTDYEPEWLQWILYGTLNTLRISGYQLIFAIAKLHYGAVGYDAWLA